MIRILQSDANILLSGCCTNIYYLFLDFANEVKMLGIRLCVYLCMNIAL